MSLRRVVEQRVLDPTSNEMPLGQCPTDLVAEHYARMPPDGARGKFPLNASFVEGREASFGATPHSGPCLPIFSEVPWQWRTFTLTRTCFALGTLPWTRQR